MMEIDPFAPAGLPGAPVENNVDPQSATQAAQGATQPAAAPAPENLRPLPKYHTEYGKGCSWLGLCDAWAMAGVWRVRLGRGPCGGAEVV